MLFVLVERLEATKSHELALPTLTTRPQRNPPRWLDEPSWFLSQCPMLQITHAQMDRLKAVSEERFLFQLCRIAKSLRPEVYAAMTNAKLAAKLQCTIKKGRSLGFTTEFELGVFAAAELMLGEDWYVTPGHPLSIVLSRDHVSPHLRALQLLYELENNQ